MIGMKALKAMNLKKTAKISSIVIMLTVFIVACGGGGRDLPNYVISRSKTLEASLFKQNCALCHGNEANGKEIAGINVPTLRFGKAANVTYEDMFDQIKNGRKEMPAFKQQLTDEQIHGLVRFIMRDLQGREIPQKYK